MMGSSVLILVDNFYKLTRFFASAVVEK